jgi:glycosyltransferase involved in cell wall biosynthesis
MRRLRALMREQSVDLVHANDYPSHKLAVVAAHGLGLPEVYHQQIAVTQRPGSTTGRLMAHHIRKADRILPVSQNSHEALLALGVPAEKLSLLYNNADTDALGAVKAIGAGTRKAAGIPAGRPLILAAGMRRPHKGFDVLLHGLAAYYAQAGRSAKARPFTALLGDGANAEPAHEALLQRLEQAPPLAGHYRHLPAQRPFGPWLKACDLFVSSSRWEGSPLVVLEAMAAGRPILATRQGAGEVLEHGRTGWLVDSEDPQALAGALALLMADAPLRRRLGASARKAAVARFSLKAYVRTLMGHYDALVGGA